MVSTFVDGSGRIDTHLLLQKVVEKRGSCVPVLSQMSFIVFTVVSHTSQALKSVSL